MASTSAPTTSFSRLYSLQSNAGTSGSDRISSLSGSGGTQGTFTLSDLPATSGVDDPTRLGDTPNDNMQVVQSVGSTTTTFTNREYVGKLENDAGVVARAFSNARNEYIFVLYTNNVYEPSQPITFSQAAFTLCFTSGTRILTTRGQVPVEDLLMGDIAVTASGRQRPITWIGHRHLGTEGTALPYDQWPVHVREGAFGPGVPARDLRLSPGHPVLVGADADGEGGVLVPVMCLINGISIARETAEAVTYWHVELDAHDILLADGLPAESFLDLGSRAFFAEASDHALHNPDFVPAGLSGRCRPVALDGAHVEAERKRLDGVFAAEFSGQCAWSTFEPVV